METQKIEDWLPKKTVKQAKKQPLFHATSLIVMTIAIIGLSVGLVLANKSLTKEKNTVATLNSNLQNKTDELTTLQYNLNQTEEGKKQVEAAKAQSDANTNTAQQQANSATAALSTAKSQLSSAQASLNSTNTQLSSAKACVALFNSVNFQITNYDTDMQNAINNLLNSLGAETAGNPSSAANYLQISQSYFNTAEGIFPQIKNVLNRVNSGICN